MSRLNQMQARFQQKQLEEKEQKLVRMYETQQAHALKRVGGTAPNTVTQTTGKVRQMFEERRTKAGIDKSYPLQPIGINNNKVIKQSVGGGGIVTKTNTSTRNGYTTKTETFKSTNHHNSNGHIVRQEVTTEVRQKSNSKDLPALSKNHHYETERILKDQNLNDEILDDVTFPDNFDLLSLETVNTKLPNVGGALPSERQAARLKENNNNVVTKNALKKPFEGVKTNGESRVKVSPVSKKVANSVKPIKASSPASSVGSPTPKAVASYGSSPVIQTPTPSKARQPIEQVEEVIKTPIKKAVVDSVSAMDKNSSPQSSPGKTTKCKICKRKFAEERLATHEKICAKAASKKRKPYDPVKHRIGGTEAEAYVKVQQKNNKIIAVPKSGPVKLKQSNWRKKHEDFIKTIRAAKEAQDHISKGGKLSDLPPPPVSENPDYVQCPHCNRKFNQQAAERHIPKCASFQFNKTKPAQGKKR